MRLLKRQQGFTLIEAVVSMGLTGLVLSLVTMSMFQAWGIERTQRHEVVAVQQLRNATDWFTKDAVNAGSSDLVDGAASVSSVVLSSTDGAGTPHTASYSLVGTRLVRDFDGNALTVAQDVVSAEFSRSERTVFLTLSTHGAHGEVRSVTVRTYLRMATGL